jgi:16S rRNA (cytosine967-C5)-methyltransferase
VSDVDALVLESLQRPGPADRVVRACLRAHPGLDGAGRRRLARGVYGVRCFEARLRHLLAGVGLEPSPGALWAAYRVDQLGEPPAACAHLAPPRALGRLAEVPFPTAPAERLAALRSLPVWIAEAWLASLGPEGADALAAAMNRPGPVTARVRRRGRAAAEARRDLAARLGARGQATTLGRLAPTALRLEPSGDAKPDVRGSPEWRAGDFEIQDEGSQLVAEAVEAGPGMTVLDLCAGAGGKTLALADAMDDRGHVVAADVDPARLADLRGRAGRLRLRAVEALRLDEDPERACLQLERSLPEGADRVLVDAPCSSLGTLRRGPHRKWAVDPGDIPALAERQLTLLELGARCLAPGGRLVYATCTLGTDENGPVADRLGARYPDLRPASPLPRLAPDPTLTLRPDLHGTDGFFIAAWHAR